MKGEHFLPFRRRDVVEMCADQLDAREQDDFRAFGRVLASLLHYRFQERIEALKDAYHYFDVEADTRLIDGALSAEARDMAQRRVEEELVKLATAANYTELPLSEVEKALTESSLLKLRLSIDTSGADSVRLFSRGESEATREIKTWYGLRRKTVRYRRYARVLLFAKFKAADKFTARELEKLSFRPGSIIVKLFQDVPREDLEMIFPNVKIRMRPLDWLLIGVPAVISGIAVIVTKLIFVIGVILAVILYWLKIRHGHDPVDDIDQTKLIAILVGLLAVGGYVVRQVNNFKNRRISFMKALSENLYHRNLDNDVGVFHHLLDSAEEAEGIETLLAYHFLRTAAGAQTAEELDRRVEAFFRDRWHTSFDFEVEDGLRKLIELQLATVDASGRYTAVPLDAALRQLDLLWDNAYVYDEPVTRPM